MAGPNSHREAIAALPGEALARLQETTDGPGLRHLASHLAALLATATLIMASSSPWVLAPALVAHGILLVFLFTPLHESIHLTAFRSPALNGLVSVVCGFLLVLPPRYFRYFHLAHHRFTQNAEHDPELASPKPSSWRGYLWALTGLPYWWAAATTLVRYAIGSRLDDFVPPKGRAKVVAEARWYLAAYVVLIGLALAFGWTFVIWLWLLPALLGQPFLRAYLMAEHTGLPLVPDMLLNSRTVFTAPLVHWLAWNMPNHTAHHALPGVPFHRLPELTRLLRPHLRSTSPGYAAVHRSIARGLGRAGAE